MRIDVLSLFLEVPDFVVGRNKRRLMLILLLLFVTTSLSKADISIHDPKQLRDKLEEIRERRKLPAVAASVVIGNDVVVASAVGFRKWGEDVPVTRNDAFELGSISKPITGTLIGILKDQGILNWDTTIGEMFPEMFPGHYGGYKKVTIRQLITHTSGLPYQPKMKQTEIDAQGDTVLKRRIAYVSAALSDRPGALPGSKDIYSGGGIIAASMAEKLTGESWERLVTELIFSKLNMTTAGFGPMATQPDLLDAPWSHQNRNGVITPLSPETTNPIHCRNPVGGVHCSVIDLGKFTALHLNGMQGKPIPNSPLKQTAFKELYTAVETSKSKRTLYTTVGWRVGSTKWAKGPVYWHAGQRRGGGYAVVHIVPEQNYATCVLMNVGGKEATEAGSEINLLLVEALRKAKYNPSRLLQ